MNDEATTQEKSKQAAGGNGAISDVASWLNGYSLESWVQSNANMMQGAAELGQEVMRFSQSRLQAYGDAWKALAACRNPSEIFECQRRFAEQATAQYLDEAGKLASRLLSVTNGVAAANRQKQGSKP